MTSDDSHRELNVRVEYTVLYICYLMFSVLGDPRDSAGCHVGHFDNGSFAGDLSNRWSMVMVHFRSLWSCGRVETSPARSPNRFASYLKDSRDLVMRISTPTLVERSPLASVWELR